MNESEFRIIVPRQKKVINEVAKRMTKRFGGVSSIPRVRGYWSQKGRTVYDKNALLFSARDLNKVKNKEKVLSQDRRFMKELAEWVSKEAKQDAVWIEEDIIRDVSLVKSRLKEVL